MFRKKRGTSCKGDQGRQQTAKAIWVGKRFATRWEWVRLLCSIVDGLLIPCIICTTTVAFGFLVPIGCAYAQGKALG